MSAKRITGVGLAGVLLLGLASAGRAQPPGGGGRGQFRFDPNMIFDRMANGRDYIVIAEMQRGRERMEQWAAAQGITNGQLTREQFLRFMQERMAERGNRGPGGGPPPAQPGAPAAPANPAPAEGGAAPTPGAMPEVVPALPPAEEEKRPTVHRPGKLPKGLPDWFAKLDTDGDGQIGLYEWKAAGRSLEEFRRLDRNGDGFITIEEALRAAKGSTAVAAGDRGGPPRPDGDSPGAETIADGPPAAATPPDGGPTDQQPRRQGRGGRQGGGRRSGGQGKGGSPGGGDNQ